MRNGSSNVTADSPGRSMGRRSFLKGISAAASLSVVAGRSASAPSSTDLRLLSSPREDDAYWRLVRNCYLLDTDYHFLNTGTEGAKARLMVEEMDRAARYVGADPWRESEVYDQVVEGMAEVADFIGADKEEVALMYNTTDGMNAVTHGLHHLREGDEVLMSDQEHPGGINPWRLREKHHGIVIKTFPTGTPPQSAQEIVAAAEKAFTPKTKVLCVSHLCYTTSLLIPVKELCALARDKGVFSLVDGAHPLGMIKLDVHNIGCDAYAASGQKWIGGPSGTGALFVRRDVLDKVDPAVVSGGWDTRNDASKFMCRSSLNISAFIGFIAAMRFQQAIGGEKIESRVRALATRFRGGLAGVPKVKLITSNDPALSGALTTLSIDGLENRAVLAALWEHYKLFPRTIGHDLNALRFSFHLYNTEDEVERSIEAIKEISERGLPEVSPAAMAWVVDQSRSIERRC